MQMSSPIYITGHPASWGSFPYTHTRNPTNFSTPTPILYRFVNLIFPFRFSDRSFLVANIRDGQCHIIYCSDGFCRLTGYSRAEVMQRSASCEFLCGPLTSQQSVAGLRDALQEGVEKHAEILYYRKDGE